MEAGATIMVPANAGLSDASEYLLAFALLSLVLVPPGFVLGRLANVLDFRSRPLSAQFGLALLLSLAVVPITLHLIGTLIAFAAVWVALGLCWLAVPLVLLQRGTGQADQSDTAFWPFLVAALLWVSLAGFLTMDLEFQGRLYRPTLHYDHAKHAAVTDSVLRTGLPPVNPSFRPGEDRPLYYYYFWQMLGGIVGRLGGDLVTPRTLALAGVAWAGIALLAAVALAVSRQSSQVPARVYALAFALLLVTGLDILPTALLSLDALRLGSLAALPPFIDTWNCCLVTAWVGLALWVPHHLAALTVAVLAWALLSDAVRTESRSRRRLNCVLMGLALASAFGLSVWVSIVLLAGLTVWGLLALLRGWWREVGVLTAVAGVMALALSPLVLELRRAQQDPTFPIAFAVRHFNFFSDWNAPLAHVHPALVPAFHTLLLPLNFGLELGAVLLGGILYWCWRRSRGEPVLRDDAFLLVMTLTTLVLCGFFVSALRNNDLGMRGTAVAQFCLLVWTIPVLAGTLVPAGGSTTSASGWRSLLLAMVLFGLLGSVYDLVQGRTRTIGPTGAEALALRQTYEWIAANTPRDAVVQHSWKPYPAPTTPQPFQGEGYHEPFHLLYGHRQAVVSDEMHGMLFSIPRARFDALAEPVVELFETGLSRDEVVRRCRRLGITVLVVKQHDPVAGDPTAWPQQIAPVFASAIARVYLVEHLSSRHREAPSENPPHADD